MLTVSVVATKGGVGKTTDAANLAGLLADFGYRVLLIDADIQPSLTRYFKLSFRAQHGLSKMVMSGALTQDCISHVELPPDSFASATADMNANGGYIHIICSDAKGSDSALQIWMSNQLDRLVRIRIALNNPAVQEAYDVCIIDTQGAVGYLQDAAVNAADVLLAPVAPDVLSAREFIDGILMLIGRHEATANLGYKVPAIQCVINKTENTVDSRTMSGLIRDQFLEMRGRVNVLNATIPHLVAFKKAATAQVPAHWIDPGRVSDAMHAFIWELIPSLKGQLAPVHRGQLAASDAITPSDANPDVELATPDRSET